MIKCTYKRFHFLLKIISYIACALNLYLNVCMYIRARIYLWFMMFPKFVSLNYSLCLNEDEELCGVLGTFLAYSYLIFSKNIGLGKKNWVEFSNESLSLFCLKFSKNCWKQAWANRKLFWMDKPPSDSKI